MINNFFFNLKEVIPSNEKIGQLFEITFTFKKENNIVIDNDKYKIIRRRGRHYRWGNKILLENIKCNKTMRILSKLEVPQDTIIEWRYVTRNELMAYL